MHANATPSEIAIFNKLANPARVSKTPRDPVAKPQSVFETAVIQELKSVAMNREQERERERSEKDDRSDRGDRSDQGYKDRDDKSEKSAEFRESQKRDELDRRSDLDTSNDAAVLEEQQREKEAMIDYINARATRGTRVTKTYTRDDPFVEVQFEYDRIKINEETTNSLGIAREGLRFMCKAVEAGNKKFGPILALDGWVDNHMAPDTMGRFDNVLERLYKKHWRKGSMAPEMELLMLLGGSMAMTHFDNVSGKRGAASPAQQPPPFARPHASGPMPFDIMNMLSAKKTPSPPPQRPPISYPPQPPFVPPPPQQPFMPPPQPRRPMRRPVDSGASVASEPETVMPQAQDMTASKDAENKMKLEMMQEQHRQRERAERAVQAERAERAAQAERMLQAEREAQDQAERKQAMMAERLQQIEAMEYQVRQRELAMEQRLRLLELKETRQHMESDFKRREAQQPAAAPKVTTLQQQAIDRALQHDDEEEDDDDDASSQQQQQEGDDSGGNVSDSRSISVVGSSHASAMSKKRSRRGRKPKNLRV
jgi:hypothetical protein